MAGDARIWVQAKWPDEPGDEYAVEGEPHALLGHFLFKLWEDRCIRRGWGTVEPLALPERPDLHTLHRLPSYVATRNDAEGPVDGWMRLGEAHITRETWFTLRRADTGE